MRGLSVVGLNCFDVSAIGETRINETSASKENIDFGRPMDHGSLVHARSFVCSSYTLLRFGGLVYSPLVSM